MRETINLSYRASDAEAFYDGRRDEGEGRGRRMRARTSAHIKNKTTNLKLGLAGDASIKQSVSRSCRIYEESDESEEYTQATQSDVKETLEEHLPHFCQVKKSS